MAHPPLPKRSHALPAITSLARKLAQLDNRDKMDAEDGVEGTNRHDGLELIYETPQTSRTTDSGSGDLDMDSEHSFGYGSGTDSPSSGSSRRHSQDARESREVSKRSTGVDLTRTASPASGPASPEERDSWSGWRVLRGQTSSSQPTRSSQYGSGDLLAFNTHSSLARWCLPLGGLERIKRFHSAFNGCTLQSQGHDTVAMEDRFPANEPRAWDTAQQRAIATAG